MAIFDFSETIGKATKDFSGREWVFAEIDQWFKDPEGTNFFIVEGEPGVGKTALAARWTQIREVAAHHFCIARQAETVEPFAFAQSISNQLAHIEGFAEGIQEEAGLHLDVDINVQENRGQVVGAWLERLLIENRSASVVFNRLFFIPSSIFTAMDSTSDCRSLSTPWTNCSACWTGDDRRSVRQSGRSSRADPLPAHNPPR